MSTPRLLRVAKAIARRGIVAHKMAQSERQERLSLTGERQKSRGVEPMTPLSTVLTESIELAKSEKRIGVATTLDAILWDLHVLADRINTLWTDANCDEWATRQALTTAVVDVRCTVSDAEFQMGVWRRKLDSLLYELTENK